jgi:glycine/D-amino acid oxidase-like deaminating enzyme
MGEAHTGSYYAASRKYDDSYPALQEDIQADVCICGGGFSGISTALTLAERGHSVVVLEQNKICWGASGRNGGQIIAGFSGRGLMLERLGEELTDTLWDIGYRGNELIAERVQKYAIDCDLKWGYVEVALKPGHMRDCEADCRELQRRGFGDDARLVEGADMRSLAPTNAYLGGLVNMRNGHLHPLNLCLGEARAAAGLGARIFEDSAVLGIEHGARPVVKTARGTVTADAVVLAGNAYQRLEMKRLGGLVFPAGSFVVATEPLSEAEAAEINPRDLAFCDLNHVVDYFRLSADRRMLFGGRCNYSGRDPASIQASIVPRMLKLFPQLRGKRIDYEWGGKIGIVVNRVPLLGRLESNVYTAFGYSGHGVSMTHATGEIIADAITGDTGKLELFERIKHHRIPLGQYLGGQMVALGMMYYKLLDML